MIQFLESFAICHCCEEFRISKLTFHSDLRRRAASRRALPCPSSFLNVLLLLQVGMGINARNEKYNTPVLAELSERGKLLCFLISFEQQLHKNILFK